MYKTFEHYSDSALMDLVESYCFTMGALNDPIAYQRHPGVLPVDSTVSFVAFPNGNLAMNFASRIVQGIMAAEIPKIESLMAEIERRGQLNVRVDEKTVFVVDSPMTSPLIQRLTRHVNEYLHFLGGVPGLSVEEIGVTNDIMTTDFSIRLL